MQFSPHLYQKNAKLTKTIFEKITTVFRYKMFHV